MHHSEVCALGCFIPFYIFGKLTISSEPTSLLHIFSVLFTYYYYCCCLNLFLWRNSMYVKFGRCHIKILFCQVHNSGLTVNICNIGVVVIGSTLWCLKAQNPMDGRTLFLLLYTICCVYLGQCIHIQNLFIDNVQCRKHTVITICIHMLTYVDIIHAN